MNTFTCYKVIYVITNQVGYEQLLNRDMKVTLIFDPTKDVIDDYEEVFDQLIEYFEDLEEYENMCYSFKF